MRGFNEFLGFARKAVADYWNGHINKPGGPELTPEEVYIAWYSKELQNQKATLSADVAVKEGLYFELTWNGDKDEAYLDVYKKLDNVVVKAEEAEGM